MHKLERDLYSWICLLICILLLSTVAKAHPADDACPPGENSVDGCQPLTNGLDNPEFYALHRAYWHERRLLNKTIQDYAQCIGAVRERQLINYGEAFTTGSQEILTYWFIIPAHPVIDEGTLHFAKDSVQAAIDTNSIFQVHLYFCNQYLGSLR